MLLPRGVVAERDMHVPIDQAGNGRHAICINHDVGVFNGRGGSGAHQSDSVIFDETVSPCANGGANRRKRFHRSS